MGKMSEITHQGRTILFVSHNTAAIQNLCTKAILIHHGKLLNYGSTESILTQYSSLARDKAMDRDLSNRQDRQGNGQARFLNYAIVDRTGKQVSNIRSGEELSIVLDIKVHHPVSPLSISIGIDDPLGQRILLLSNEIAAEPFLHMAPDIYKVTFRIAKVPLKSGQYPFTIFAAAASVVLDWVQTAGYLEIEASDYYGTGKLPPDSQGSFLLDYEVSISQGLVTSRVNHLNN
jgi:lipopolysaccharide transport system ATP-binding protein